jgi:hypothetical protein
MSPMEILDESSLKNEPTHYVIRQVKRQLEALRVRQKFLSK